MKIIKITLMLALLTFSCSSQSKKKEVINKFVEEVILNESYDLSKINKFININTDSLISDSNTYKQLKFNIDLIRYDIINNNNKFKIVTYKKFKNTFREYNIVYKNTNEIFCILSNDELITPFIIDENDKIISFYSGLIKNNNRINPFIYERIN